MNTMTMTLAKYDVGDSVAFKGPNGSVVRCFVKNVLVSLGTTSDVSYHLEEEEGVEHVKGQDELLRFDYVQTPLFNIGSKVSYLDDEEVEKKTASVIEVCIRYCNYTDKKTKETTTVYDIEYTLDNGEEVYEDDVLEVG